MTPETGPRTQFNTHTVVEDGGSIFGQLVVSTGHGGVGGLPPRPKGGPGLAIGANSFQWYGFVIPGDSGSGARLAGGLALGAVTHLGLVPPGVSFGTRVDRGLALAANQGFTNLQLVTVGHVHGI